MKPVSLPRTIVIFSALLGVAACGPATPPPEPPRPVLTQVLGAAAADTTAVYAGEVRSRFETPLGFRVSGKIAQRLVNTGAQVKAGEVLARLDPADLELNAASARAQLDLAEADVRRYRELKARNFISASALDAKETAYRSARAQADLARNQAAYAALKADKDGVVQLIAAEVGQVVAAGQTVMQVARTDTLEVAVAIPESRLAGIRLKGEAEITLWADETARFRGVVRELSRTADSATRTYAARVTIVDPDARVLLGMTANVRFRGTGGDDNSGGRLSVPLGAVFQKDGKPALWIVGADETVALRPVDIASYGETTAVLAAGAAAGERVVIAGVHKLSPGEKVKPVDSSAPAQR